MIQGDKPSPHETDSFSQGGGSRPGSRRRNSPEAFRYQLGSRTRAADAMTSKERKETNATSAAPLLQLLTTRWKHRDENQNGCQLDTGADGTWRTGADARRASRSPIALAPARSNSTGSLGQRTRWRHRHQLQHRSNITARPGSRGDGDSDSSSSEARGALGATRAGPAAVVRRRLGDHLLTGGSIAQLAETPRVNVTRRDATWACAGSAHASLTHHLLTTLTFLIFTLTFPHQLATYSQTSQLTTAAALPATLIPTREVRSNVSSRVSKPRGPATWPDRIVIHSARTRSGRDARTIRFRCLQPAVCTGTDYREQTINRLQNLTMDGAEGGGFTKHTPSTRPYHAPPPHEKPHTEPRDRHPKPLDPKPLDPKPFSPKPPHRIGQHLLERVGANRPHGKKATHIFSRERSSLLIKFFTKPPWHTLNLLALHQRLSWQSRRSQAP